MAAMNPAGLRPGSDEDEAFGWQLFHDRQRNLVYYLHSYTGEVRWPRPETVGFVMHGLKPLPAHAQAEDTSVVNPDIWSPYYPHVVMLPSGLVQVHPGPGSEARGASEMWCGYNRFPLRNFNGNADNRVPTQYGASGSEEKVSPSTGPRVLPPTWEESRSGSPFLPPYPVTVLGRDDTETKRPAERPRPPLRRLDERFQTPEIEPSRSYRQLQQSGELGRVQGSMDWASFSRELPPNATSAPMIERKQPVYSKVLQVVNTEKKEHNRKGYLLRQARRMMRESGASSSGTTAAPKQRKPQEESSTTKARREFSSRELDEDKQENFPSYGDYETISPLHC